MLEVRPKARGLDTRQELLRFYEENYSANFMHLVVYAKESPEKIESLVQNKFQEIRNIDRSYPRFSGQPCTSEHLQILVKTVPIKHGHKLRIIWPITPGIHHYIEGPSRYLGHLIGHEGEGSLFYVLKNLGWATSLSAGESDWTYEFSFFKVNIDLTDAGHDHVEHIIGLMFKYILLLRQSGVGKWIFDEGFRKVEPDRWEFANESFLRGQKQLLKSISRRKPAHVQQSPEQLTPVQSTSAPSRVEAARFEIEEDVQYLKKDKNVIMQELVTLRQQQQATDQNLLTVGHRVQLMEQKQQQMMSFLAKAMQSPGFLSQLMHQENESKRRISGAGKKRRLPNQNEDILVSKYGSPSPDGQVVNYQPSMHEAAKAMLRQILKINASARLEPTINHANGFLIGDVPSPANILDISTSTSRISGVTLSEVLPTHVQSPAALAIPVSRPPVDICEVQPSSGVASGTTTRTPFPKMNVLSTEDGASSTNSSEMPGAITESSNKESDMTFVSPMGTCDVELMDMIAGLEDREIPVLADDFSSNPDIDVLVDENPKLPSINDVFWEQFLSSNPVIGDACEHSSSMLEGVAEEQELHTVPESGWDGVKNMNHLTEHMGLLASESVVV